MSARQGHPRPVGAIPDLGLPGLPSAPPYVPPAPKPLTIAQAVTLGGFAGASTEEIVRLVTGAYIEIIPDWSGSTFTHRGGDLRDVWGAAGESVLNLLARYGGGTGSVGPWGSTAPPALAAGPLDVKRHRRQLVRALRNRVNLGGNDQPAAVSAAADRLPKRSDQRVAAFVITDACEPVTQAVHDAVAMLPPNSCHLVIVDPLHFCSPELEAEWRTVSYGSVTRIEDTSSVKGLATEMAAIYAATLGLSLAPTAIRARKSLLNWKKEAR